MSLSTERNHNPVPKLNPPTGQGRVFSIFAVCALAVAFLTPGWAAESRPAESKPAPPETPAAPTTPAEASKPIDPVKPAESSDVPKPVVPAKRIEINKTTQTLSAYEGDQLFLRTRVSTGKWDKATPNGSFKAQEKDRMHRSKKYNNAAMPFSIWVSGNCFIHGFASVPHYPASHGCIRVPLSQDNPAKRLFEWVDIGTPIEITGQWPE